MARSLKKGPFIDYGLLKLLHPLGDSPHESKVKIDQKGGNQGTSERIRLVKPNDPQSPIYVWSRRACILPQWVGIECKVYTGKTFHGFKVKEEIVGHKFGEFASTRRKLIHKQKKKRK